MGSRRLAACSFGLAAQRPAPITPCEAPFFAMEGVGHLSLEVTWLFASEPFLLLGLGRPGGRRNSLSEFSSGFLDISELFQVSALSPDTCGVDEERNQQTHHTHTPLSVCHHCSLGHC